MQLELENHVAVVTGGASGIGWAVARSFAAEGTKVALWDISESVDDQADQLRQDFDVSAVGIRVDITEESQVNAATESTANQIGPIDHLAHCAAIGSGHFGFPFTNLRPGDWPRTLEVNVLGTVIVTHAVVETMKQQGSGTMTFLSSVAGQIGSQTDPPYSASKAAVINFAQCAAKDLAPHGIRVNSVCPGMVQTPLNRGVWQAWHDRQPEEDRRSYEDWAAEKIRNVVPLGKWQHPEDIADMVVFLSSARAAHVTGQTINVDGGFVMHW